MLTFTDEQLDWLVARLPISERNPKGGRPEADRRRTLQGIFWILDNGEMERPPAPVRKQKHRSSLVPNLDHGRRVRAHPARGRPVRRARGGYKLYECYIDATFAKAKGGGDGIGCTKAGKGVKIMVLVDARGLPVAVETMSAAPHESRLAQGLFDFMLTTQMPLRVIGDKAYDSDALDQAARAGRCGIDRAHRSNRKSENITQDGRPLRRYKRRWIAERTISWIQNFRRLCIRWEKTTPLFQGFLHLGCTLLLLRVVLG
ncbi:MAG: transposase [Phycisphaerae bacterium]